MNFLVASIVLSMFLLEPSTKSLPILKTPVGVSLSYFLSGCKDKKLIFNNQTFYTLF